MLAVVDDRGTGEFNFVDFVRMLATRHLSSDSSDEEILNSFKVFDKDGNGFISPVELEHISKIAYQCLPNR